MCNEKELELKSCIISTRKVLTEVRRIIYDFVYGNNNPSIHICHIERSHEEFVSIFSDKIELLIASIDKINKLISRKKYTDIHLAEQAFFTEYKEPKIYFVFHSQLIEKSLKRQYFRIHPLILDPNSKENDNVIGFLLFLADMIINCSTFYFNLACWKEIDIREYGYAAMRKTLTAKEIYWNSLAIARRTVFINDICTVPVSIFQLRQAIELRICEVLGIYSMYNEDNQIIKITSEKLFEVNSIEDNYILPLKKSILLNIHSWTNLYIHKGYVDDLWLIDFALNLVDDFICKNIYVRAEYYNCTYINEISEKIHVPIEKIQRIKNNHNVILIQDNIEFEKCMKSIMKVGYKEYEKKQQEEFEMKLMTHSEVDK